jgi:hypothetical protein
MGLNVPPGLTLKTLSYADRVAFNHVLLLGFSQPPSYTLRLLFPKMLTPAVSPPSHFTTLHWPWSDVDHSLLSSAESEKE